MAKTYTGTVVPPAYAGSVEWFIRFVVDSETRQVAFYQSADRHFPVGGIVYFNLHPSGLPIAINVRLKSVVDRYTARARGAQNSRAISAAAERELRNYVVRMLLPGNDDDPATDDQRAAIANILNAEMDRINAACEDKQCNLTLAILRSELSL